MFDKTKFKKYFVLEVKILLSFVIILLCYLLYDFIRGLVFDTDRIKVEYFENKGSYSENLKSRSTIKDAIESNKPITLDMEELQSEIKDLESGDVQITSMEVAVPSDTPIIWIYMRNDGTRKDFLADEFCKILHSKGVRASTVLILDERAKRSGKFIEIGERKCQ